MKDIPQILIVGAGFGGIGLAIRLRDAGYESVTILEKGDGVGGTWRDNTYPGAACDSPSFQYCYSFHQKTDWSRKWAKQPEILAYIAECAARHGVTPQIRFRTEVASAHFDAVGGKWHVTTTAGEEFVADILVSAVGQLHRPKIPEIPGSQSFRGTRFHSAEWPAGFDPAGHRIGLVGSAASAVQAVPELAKHAERLYVFQRTPNWIVPKNDRLYGRAEQRLYARFPRVAQLYRSWLWVMHELRYPVLRGAPFVSRRAREVALDHLHAQVADPLLRKALTPDYPIGAKRILITDDYYPALQRPNVRLVTDGVARITETGAETRAGESIEFDTLIYATGFETTSFLQPMEIRGREGRSLEETWTDGAEAYLGLVVPGFPNFFMLYGPNTNLGHNSIIFMLECQFRYVLECVRVIAEHPGSLLELREQAMRAFNDRIQGELTETVWAQIPASWYKDAHGRITNNWPGTTIRYWWQTRHVDFADFRIRTGSHAIPAHGESKAAQ